MSSSVAFRFSAFMIFSFCFTSSLLYALATDRSKSARLDFRGQRHADSRSTAAAAIMPADVSFDLVDLLRAVPSRLPCECLRLNQNASDVSASRQARRGECQIRLRLVEHQIDEDAGFGLHRTDDVILLPERDEDVLDRVR